MAWVTVNEILRRTSLSGKLRVEPSMSLGLAAIGFLEEPSWDIPGWFGLTQ